MKKASGNVIILQVKCAKNHDRMMYASWNTECERQNFFVVLGHILTFYLTIDPKNQNLEKKCKKGQEKLPFDTCVP